MAQKQSSDAPPGRFERWGPWLACLLLVVGTLAVYWQVVHFTFVNCDDPAYVTENVQVQSGLNWESFKWAWGANVAANWHPLTLLSHMLDCQLFGLNPGRHHFVNVLFHAANACLLFALLWRATRKGLASFLVAALFAWHPLHVESVAWISERKDVLSTCFGLLSLLAYVRYARESKIKDQRSKIFYALALLGFVFSLLSKPMLVTLPFVMLLLDYWPLRRMGWGRLAWEKIPFLLLTIIFCGVTLWAQKTAGAVIGLQIFSLKLRLANVILAYWSYLGKMIYPTDLALFYPYWDTGLTVPLLLAGLAFLALCIAVFFTKDKRYITVGWLWFCGMLVPVIGLVQVGLQAMADRYTYLPAVGIFIMVAFGLSDLAVRFRFGRTLPVMLMGVVFFGCLAGTWRQAGYWRDSETLFRHAIAITKFNQIAYNDLGVDLERQGRLREAVDCFREAVRENPAYVEAHCNLAIVYHRLKEPAAETIREFESALKINPDDARAHYFLAVQMMEAGDAAGAIEHFRAGVALRPDDAIMHYQLAIVLAMQGATAESQRHFREALRINPHWQEALNNLAWSLATQPDARFRNGKEAVELAAQAVAISHTNNATVLDTQAAALAEAGRFPEAIAAARLAANLSQAEGHTNIILDINEHLRLYEQGLPFHTPPSPAAKLGP